MCNELPLMPDADTVEDALYILERPSETIARRRKELQLSVEDFARGLDESVDEVQDMLDEEVPASENLLHHV